MASQSTILQAVYDELRVVGDAYVTDDPDTHVVYDQDPHTESLPALAFRAREVPRRGSDGQQYVVSSVTRDGSGDVTDIEYAERLRLVVTITVAADGTRRADSLYTDLRERFGAYLTSLTLADFHPDVSALEVGGSQPANRGGYVRGDDLTLTIDYCRFQTFSDFVPINEVQASFTSDDMDPNTSFDLTC